MAIILNLPEGPDTPHLRPHITVVGVGGAGGNAINNMIECNLAGVDFVVANTDAQSLAMSRTSRRIQLGAEATQGLGAGAQPEVGRRAAEEAIDAIAEELRGSHMVFITAGMGGGTGTGAAPVVAHVAREMGILTVGVVSKPFQFEGIQRMRMAEGGIEELSREVDTLIIIPNQNLFHIANERTTFADAFRLADDVLYSGVRSVTDLMINPGLINLDFADVRRVMQNMGRAMMGTGEAEGDRRALDAAESAIANPLLEDTSMRGAQGVLINIIGGPDLTLYELDEAANRIREEVENEAMIIVGSTLDPNLEGRVRVSVVATGINGENGIQQRPIDPVQQIQTPDLGQVPGFTFSAPQERPGLVPGSPLVAPAQRQASVNSPEMAPAARPAAVAQSANTAGQVRNAHADAVRTLENLLVDVQTTPRQQATAQVSQETASQSAHAAPGTAGSFARSPVAGTADNAIAQGSNPGAYIPQPVAEVGAGSTPMGAYSNEPAPSGVSSMMHGYNANIPSEPTSISRQGAGHTGETTYGFSGQAALDAHAHGQADSFPPPLPPSSRSSHSDVDGPGSSSMRGYREELRDTARPVQKQPRKSGLFGFLTGRSSRENTVASELRGQQDPHITAKPLTLDDDYDPNRPRKSRNGDPEIPAFLRRQAN